MAEHELRCAFCRRSPLLATYGIRAGKLFVRVKIWKQRRIFGEVVAEGGPLRIRCRECMRWHTVHFGTTRATLSQDSVLPDVEDDDSPAMLGNDSINP